MWHSKLGGKINYFESSTGQSCPKFMFAVLSIELSAPIASSKDLHLDLDEPDEDLDREKYRGS